MIGWQDLVDADNWDIFIEDGQPVEKVNLQGLAQLVKGSPLGIDLAMQALRGKGMNSTVEARVWLELASL